MMNHSLAGFLVRDLELDTVYCQRAEVAAALAMTLTKDDSGVYTADGVVDGLAHRRRELALLTQAAEKWLSLINEGPAGVQVVRDKLNELAVMIKVDPANGSAFGKVQTDAWRLLFNGGPEAPTQAEVDAI